MGCPCNHLTPGTSCSVGDDAIPYPVYFGLGTAYVIRLISWSANSKWVKSLVKSIKNCFFCLKNTMDVVSRGIVVPFFLWMKQQRISAVVNLGASKGHRYALPRGHPSKSLGTHSRSCRCLGHNGGYGTPMAHGPSQSNVHIEYLCILYICIYIICICICIYIYMHMYVHMYIHTCIYISRGNNIYVIIHLHLFAYLFVYLFVYIFVNLFVYLFVYLYVCLFVHLSI